MAKRKSITERLLSNIEIVPWSGCWIWMASCYSGRYGVLSVGMKNKRAHRVSWETFKGPIPEGMKVLHQCDIPCCINPSHLFIGTDADNMKDRDAKERQCKGADHPHSKLTPESAKRLLEFRRTHSLSETGKMFGVTRQRVWQLERGIKCKHLQL